MLWRDRSEVGLVLVKEGEAGVKQLLGLQPPLRRAWQDRRMRTLLVEDEDSIALPLVEGLEREGFDVTRVATAAEALEPHDTDVVLLDLRLPDGDGYEVCRELRSRSNVPIIMITARGDEIDRVVGLELGADDYVVKPFGFRELVARIRAVTRRAGGLPAASREIVSVGCLTIDLPARRARLGDGDVPLTAKEFDILAALALDPDTVVSRRQIVQLVWGGEWYGPTKMIDVHMSSLRRKLGDPRWIENVRGVGFRLQPPA
jgi:DNA-binding response OmpR family regulator